MRCALRIRPARRYAHFLSVFNSIDTDKYPPDQHLHPQPTKHPPRVLKYSHPACPNCPNVRAQRFPTQHCHCAAANTAAFSGAVASTLQIALSPSLTIPSRVRPCDSMLHRSGSISRAELKDALAGLAAVRSLRRQVAAATATHARPHTACSSAGRIRCGCERQTSAKAFQSAAAASRAAQCAALRCKWRLGSAGSFGGIRAAANP